MEKTDNVVSAPKKKIQKTINKKKTSEIEVLIRARYPLIYVVSWEEQRLLEEVVNIAGKLNKKVFEWSITMGLVPAGTSIQSQKHKDSATQDPLVALDTVIEHVEPALYVFKDFHPFIKGQNMSIVRRLREVASSLKNTYKTIVIVSPTFQMPPELEKDLTVVDYDLPKRDELGSLVTRIVNEVDGNPKLNVKMNRKTYEQIVHALLGLTISEAENVLAKTLVTNRGFDQNSLKIINNEKKQIIRKSGLLEYYDTDETMNSVGGLEQLKHWLMKRSAAFEDEAREFGLPAPKGILLLGIQGCGKSLMAKTISNVWKLPLLRFDIGQVFGSLVGSSEENMRRAIRVAESISPVIFWVDEIDKAFRGSKGSGGSTDGGTSARVFGTFLTWMSEKCSPVFVVATANDISALPPELLRKGRFDEIFFVDLPNHKERELIFDVHISKRNISPEKFDFKKLAAKSEGYSGAEIEEAVISAMFEAYYNKMPLDTNMILAEIENTVPLSQTMNEDIESLRRWASVRARPATFDDSNEDNNQMRNIEL